MACVNKCNDSDREFNVNHWKDCRKPNRQAAALAYEEINGKLEEGLKALKIACYCASDCVYTITHTQVSIHNKDANAALLMDRAHFRDNVSGYLAKVAEQELNGRVGDTIPLVYDTPHNLMRDR